MRKLLEAVAPLFQEDVRDDNKESMFLNSVQEIIKDAEEAGAYGDVRDRSIERAYSYFQKGDFGGAVEEILGNFSDQDGGEVDALQHVYDDAVSDMEYLAKEMLKNLSYVAEEVAVDSDLERLQEIMDELENLGMEAKSLMVSIDPEKARTLDAYGAFNFGSSDNQYDTTFANAVGELVELIEKI